MLATMVAVPTWPMIIVGVIHLLLLQWEARREEQHLINVHGDIYRDYYKRVGRFLPRHVRGYSSAQSSG
jgi:protein-S-isoprenylcysteine O-methyltransferase Ste14